MFCSNCGNQLEEGDAFCAKCGMKISEEETDKTVDVTDLNQSNNQIIIESGNNKSKEEDNDRVSEEIISNTPFQSKKLDPQLTKKIGIILGILAMVIVICGIVFFVSSHKKSPWITNDTINLDILKCYQKTATRNDGGLEAVNCYKLSNMDIERIWRTLPKKFIYGGEEWYPFSPEYNYISDYNTSWQELMYNYDILCSPIYQYEYGNYIWTYVINRKTGQVMAF